MPWEWKSVAVKIRMGEAISFLKMIFIIIGKVNTHKCMPISLFTHVSYSLTHLELARRFPSHFLCNSFILSYPETR